MIPIIAIGFGGRGEATDAVGVGAILGRPVHALHAGDVRDRCRRRSRSGAAAATGTRMVVDTTVLVHDIRYFVVAYALAIATAFLPPDLGLAADRRRGGADRDLRLVREGPLRRRGRGPRGRAGAAALPSPRPARAPARAGQSRGCGSWAPRSWSPSGCIIGGAYLFVGAVERRRRRARGQRAPAGARDRADRDRAAREVQLADLGPPGQGHARDGQHHGRDGLPVGHPDGGRAGRWRAAAWHVNADSLDRVPVGGHRVRSPCAAVFGPMWRRARLDGRALLVGGGLYLVYLAIVLLAIAGVAPFA